MRIFHLATLDDWEMAKLSGRYTTSTLGVPLEAAGFIHASRREQVRSVAARYYADVSEPLVLLEIETDLLDVPWREDPVDGDTFPHVYGPLSVRAVVGARPFAGAAGPPRAPTTQLVLAFRGVGLVLLVAGVTLLVLAWVATHRAHQSLHPTAAPTVLWSLTVTVLMAAGTSLVYAEWVRWRPLAPAGAEDLAAAGV